LVNLKQMEHNFASASAFLATLPSPQTHESIWFCRELMTWWIGDHDRKHKLSRRVYVSCS
jgi:hypothetical protein